MSAVLRAARSTDAGRVGDILSEFIDSTPWLPRVHSRAEDLFHAGQMIERGWVSVFEGAQGVVAFLAREGGKVHALYVAAPARNQGHGSTLIKSAQREASALELWTFQENQGAQRFYVAHGFTETERTDGAGNDEGLPDIKYQWRREPM